MSRFMRTLQQRMRLMAISLIIGTLGGPLLFLLKTARLVEVQGYEKWKLQSKEGRGVLVIFRHPSMLETVVIVIMLWREYRSHPLRPPLVTPDQANFFERKKHWWYWAFLLLRPISIPVDRNSEKGGMRAARRILRALGQGQVVLTAPEGGRTWKGRVFKVLDGTKIREIPRPEDGLDLSQPIIRSFQPGVGLLARGTVLPVWVIPKKRGRRLRIMVGAPFFVDSSAPREEATAALENAMLRTAVS